MELEYTTTAQQNVNNPDARTYAITTGQAPTRLPCISVPFRGQKIFPPRPKSHGICPFTVTALPFPDKVA